LWNYRIAILQHTLKGTWNLVTRGLEARRLSDCVEGIWRDWKHARKSPILAG
jgi:hypothetical protein